MSARNALAVSTHPSVSSSFLPSSHWEKCNGKEKRKANAMLGFEKKLRKNGKCYNFPSIGL